MNNPLKSSQAQAWFLTLLLVFSSLSIFADPQLLTGELVVTLPAKVNNQPAKTGMTILPGSSFEVGKDGMAAVNLDKLGRVTVQSDTNFWLNFGERTVGGKLSLGTVVVNIPCGVDTVINTPKGDVTVPPDQGPATLTVEVTAEGTRSSISREANAVPCTPAAGRTSSSLGVPRAINPINPPAVPPLGGWMLPLFLVGGGGFGAALALAVNNSVFPAALEATPVTP